MTAPASEFDRRIRPALPFLLVLFVGSGASALIYEVVWFQLLELVIGSSAISLGVLLATFMGGMCLGSLGWPRVAARFGLTGHPLRNYAVLEIAIGVIGLLELALIPVVGKLYSPAVGHGALSLALRAVVTGLCLLPPTILMGATLPAIARWVESSPRGIAWLGYFYGGNTAGAVVGSVLAGFWLLRLHDATVATFVAATCNVIVALLALVIAARTPSTPGTPTTAAGATAATVRPGARLVYITAALSGGCALAAEVVWTRLLSLTFGASTYTFSMILAVILAGLGVGSASGAALARSGTPGRALARAQLLLTLGIAWAATVIYVALPNWPVNPSLAPSAWINLQFDLFRCAVVVLPSALLWGASFPLALAALAVPGEDTSRLVGRVYAANTVGAILGATLCSLVFVPMLGTYRTQQLLIGLAALASVLAYLAFNTMHAEPAAHAGKAAKGAPDTAAGRRALPVGIAAAPLLAGVLIATIPNLPGALVAHGRWAVTWLGKTEMLYVGEGMNSSVAVTRLLSNDAIQFHVSGKVEASSLMQDMRLQKMLAHIPALVHPNPQSVLVVGFGAGVTAGSFLPYPTVKRLVICELEPLVPKVVSTWFTKENNNVANDPRTQIYFDDARSFVLTANEQFDIITSDPINPWVKGAATLYTREYFEAVKKLLKPGGVVTQWVPLYESTPEAVKSELATFFEVFPNGTVWANNLAGGGYDLVLLGTNDAQRIDIGAIETRAQTGFEKVASSLMESNFSSSLDLFSTYAGSAKDLQPYLQGAEINTDRSLRLQYLAALGLNSYTNASIAEEIFRFRRFPEGLFVASDAWQQRLAESMGVMR
ncbi:MAG: fused MFS/spermidine synthase [Gemmatimonadetes bacterium]|nr:fused MFS/spermidine synthase [Gemmatimonadota bacterium]